MIVGVASVLALPWRRDASHVRKGGLADGTSCGAADTQTAARPAPPEIHRVTKRTHGDRRDAGHQTAPDQWLARGALEWREGR